MFRAALTLALSLWTPGAAGHAATGESLSVDLSSTRGPSTGVGEGFLYGISEDGTQPVDQYLQPLGLNAFRGGGWFSGGWIKDNYQYGAASQADVNSIIEQARRLTQSPYHAQYQVLVTDMYGLNGGQPLCADVFGNTTTAGAAIDQWTCNSQSNQEFQFVPVSGGAGELQTQNSGLDVAVANSSTTAGTADIVQQAVNAAPNSLWVPVVQSDGS